MKNFYSGMLVMLALMLAIVMGVVALAESAEPAAPELPAIESVPAATEPNGSAEATGPAADSTALQDALNAYNQARQSSRMEDLESELNGFVASGKLTQAQADLILNHYKEQESLRNGVCPNCGYAFQNDGGFGRGGRMNGGKGGRGGHGMRGFGQQMAPSQSDTQANGTAFENDMMFDDDMMFEGGMQVMPNISGLEGI